MGGGEKNGDETRYHCRLFGTSPRYKYKTSCSFDKVSKFHIAFRLEAESASLQSPRLGNSKYISL